MQEISFLIRIIFIIIPNLSGTKVERLKLYIYIHKDINLGLDFMGLCIICTH